MATPRTYTETIAVGIPIAECLEIEERTKGVDLSAALRDATLRIIGREDLVFEETRSNAGRKRPRRSKVRRVVSPVRLTKTQKKAIEAAAKEANVATATLMLNSLRFELELAPRAPSSHWDGVDSIASKVRALAAKLVPGIRLPLEKGTASTAVPLEIRRKLVEQTGASRRGVLDALERVSSAVGWQVGRRKSSRPKSG